MNCLCCNKPLVEPLSPQERTSLWHDKCVKAFFGTSLFPSLDFSKKKLVKIASLNTNNGYTIPGVQKKLSLSFEKGKYPRLTMTNYPTGYILKPASDEYLALPEAEYLVMHMAKKTGIKTVPFGLIRFDEGYNYITKRIDHSGKERLAMEDFCQLQERLTQDKYKGSYERCAQTIKKYSSLPGFDLSELFLRLVFSFVTGNSDMHLKNFSLIEDKEGSQRFSLSPSYDLLPVNILLPEDKEEFALTMNGKKRNLRKKDFLLYAENIGLSPLAAKKMIDDILSLKDTYVSMCKESYLPRDLKQDFIELIEQRISIII